MEKLKSFLCSFSEKNAAASFSAMPLEGDAWKNNQLSLLKKLSPKKTENYPEYFKKTLAQRQNPLSLFPWAKSVFMFALPFDNLPKTAGNVKMTDIKWKSGLISGYAFKKDYHIKADEFIRKFTAELELISGEKFTFLPSVDTKPVPEKILGILSGLGKTGFNSCLLCGRNGSGCYIVSLFTGIAIAGIINSENIPHEKCSECRRCIDSCPSAVIQENSFDISKCISYLCGEKRGPLTEKESMLIGSWVFGCGLCVINCPSSKMPEAENIDLEWLLMSPSADMKKAISGTALEHAGITLLRRNALYVLENKKNEHANKLIEDFRKIQNSPLLENVLENIYIRLQSTKK